MDDYINNSEEEIIKLKDNLMSASTGDSLSKIILDTSHQIKSEEVGLILEENLRQLFTVKLGWKNAKLERQFNYREIKIGNIEKIVTPKISQTFEINRIKYIFSLHNNGVLELINENNKEKAALIDPNNELELKYNNEKVTISKNREIEIDGLFEAGGFNLNIFNPEEIKILINTTQGIDINSIDFIVMEAKLNISKIKDMISQLERDKNVVEKLINNNILYLGIVNLKDFNINLGKIDFNLKCLILGIKGTNFFGKDLTKYLDWSLIREVAELKNCVDFSVNKINEIELKIDLLLKEVQKKKTKKQRKFKKVGGTDKMLNKKRDSIPEDE